MKPLSESQTGALDDDFNNMRTWIYSDYGRVVVTPARPPRPAIPYLQNGFALLQIAVQEAREYHATILPFLALSYISYLQAAKSISCVLSVPPCTKSPFVPSNIFPYPTPEFPWGMVSHNVLTLIIFLCGWPIYFTCVPSAISTAKVALTPLQFPCAFDDFRKRGLSQNQVSRCHLPF